MRVEKRDARLKIQIISLFSLISLILGSYFIFSISPMTLPDGDMHLDNTIALAQGNFFPRPDKESVLNKNANSVQVKNVSPTISIPYKFSPYNLQSLFNNMTITDVLKNLKQNGPSPWVKIASDLSELDHPVRINLQSQYPLINWTPQALGLAFANMSRRSLAGSFIFMRYANLIFYILIFACSLYLLPSGEVFALLLGLNPFMIVIAASISGDTFTIGIVSLFLALSYRLIYKKKEITKKEGVLGIVLGFLLFMIKFAYVPLLFLVYVVPKKKLKLKEKNIYFFSLGVIGSISYFLWSKRFGYTNQLAANLEKTNSRFFLHYPFEVIGKIVKSSFSWFYHYFLDINLRGMDGKLLLLFLVILILRISYLLFKGKIQEINFFHLVIGLLSAWVTVLLTLFALFLTWTIISDTEIIGNIAWGFQGRYLLPLSLLMLIPFMRKERKKVQS